MRTFAIAAALLAGCVSEESFSSIADELADQSGAELGAVMVSADFDGDGIDDLAVTAAEEAVGPEVQGNLMFSGAVFLYHGATSGLVGWKVLTAADFGVPVRSGDNFGAAMAARDMNGDGRADLVIGAPGFDAEGQLGAGAVFVYIGSNSGPIPGSRVTTERHANAVPEGDDGFGSAIALGKFDGVTPMVAVGAQGEQPGSGSPRTGWVAVLDWVGDSLLVGDQNLREGAFPQGIADGDRFGAALAITDANGDGIDDLVVGAPQYQSYGAAYIFTGSSSGLVARQRIVPPHLTAGEAFGGRLASGVFRGTLDGVRRRNVAIAAPAMA